MASFSRGLDPDMLPAASWSAMHLPSSRPTVPTERCPRRVALGRGGTAAGRAALGRTRRFTAAGRRQQPGGEDGEQGLRDLRVDRRHGTPPENGWWQDRGGSRVLPRVLPIEERVGPDRIGSRRPVRSIHARAHAGAGHDNRRGSNANQARVEGVMTASRIGARRRVNEAKGGRAEQGEVDV
jgi:hypothetical protein